MEMRKSEKVMHGMIMMIIGVFLFALGAIGYITNQGDRYYNFDTVYWCMLIGNILIVVGIPVLCVGACQNKTIESHNLLMKLISNSDEGTRKAFEDVEARYKDSSGKALRGTCDYCKGIITPNTDKDGNWCCDSCQGIKAKK